MHSVPKGSETHFKVVVVSDHFKQKSLLDRHREVNSLLSQQLQTGVHALSIQAKSIADWQKCGGEVPNSPACMGGMAKESKEKEHK